MTLCTHIAVTAQFFPCYRLRFPQVLAVYITIYILLFGKVL